jgi:hypothetical protein
MRDEAGHSDARELLGLAETAELLGISKAAICDRRRRKVRARRPPRALPAPLAELKCGPVWEQAQIAAYAAEAERLFVLSWLERHGIDPDELLGAPCRRG